MKKLILAAAFLMANFICLAQVGNTSYYEPLRTLSFEDYTALRAKVYIDGVLQTGSRYELGVYCGPQVRGGAFVNDSHAEGVYNIPMYGQPGDVFTFRLYDHETHAEATFATSASFTTSADAGYHLTAPTNLEFFTARTMTFTNVSGDDWNTLANWGGVSALPTSHDHVIVNGHCVVTQDATANSVEVLQGGTLVVQAALATTETRIDDGGQLCLDDDATFTGVLCMLKDIPAYSDGHENYTLVSSPLAASTFDPTMLRAQMRKKEFGDSAYDLYAFDESEIGEEWRNFKDTPFTMSQGEGYLYEHEGGTTVVFIGEANTQHSQTFDLPISGSYGYSLVGNPFPGNAVVTSNKTDTQFARLKADGSGFERIIDTPVVVAPCSAIFVRARQNGATMTFTVQTPAE